MVKNSEFVFAEVAERPRANSIAIKRQRVIEGLSRQSTDLARFVSGHWSPRMWFWADEGGHYFLEVRYAKKPLPLKGGKSVIICDSLEDVAAKIDQLKMMVRAGDLDRQIETVSEAIRTRFKRTKK